MRNWMLTCFVSVIFVSPVIAQQGDWKLVWQDDFNRAELGDGWFIRQGGSAVKIVDGRLFMGSGAPVVLVNRPFAPDVKIEFTAEADPKQPPCDLSVAMAGSKLKGYGHLLAFGGQNNQSNQIVGGGAHARDKNPAMLIETGKRYRLTGVKEGPWLRYYVNGKKIVEAEVREPLGGPGFDHVGLVTWNGMYVDDVKVYERTTPAPGGPQLLGKMPAIGFTWTDRKLSFEGKLPLRPAVTRGVELYNQRQYAQAAEQLMAVTPPTLRSVTALAYVLGDLGYDCTPAEQGKLVELCRAITERQRVDPRARTFQQAAELFARVRIFPRDPIACVRLIQSGPEDNPFYYKAKMFQARFHHASALEGGDRKRRGEAIEMFAELKKIWPEHVGLRGFTGEKIPWGEELIHPESAGPSWARHLQEAFARHQTILTWWFTERQFPDGQLGGGWGDDVELMRTWVPASCISSACEPAVAGIERLADGVWNRVLMDGYDPDPGDVEHSAEPSADTLPTMILLRYGDPLWVERNLRSAKTLRERCMGINERGFLHFKSTYIGAKGANTNVRAGGDTGYHARAMKHFIWLAWYGIPEARDVYAQWCDGWHDVTMRQIGNKFPGFPPASVWFPSGDIAPPTGRPWYDELSNSYGFPGLPVMIHDSFLTAYFLTSDLKYLDPVETMMDHATLGPLTRGDPSQPPDSRQNLLAKIAHQAGRDTTSVYRWLTGSRVYDEYTLRQANATQRYFIDYDLDQYMKSFEGQARSLRNNLAMFTSEVLQTDRAGLGGAVQVCGAYTGAVVSFRDSRAPTLSVTYDMPDLNFASVVTETTPRRLRLMMFNFHDRPRRVGIRPWRLEPGVYVVNTGQPVPGERPGQNRYTWTGAEQIALLRRGEPIWVDLPPRTEWVVDLRLRLQIPRPALLPDPAIAPRDLQIRKGQVTVTVHNIGGAPAGAFDVALQRRVKGGGWQDVARQSLAGLPAIRAFNPVRQDVTLPVPKDGGGQMRVVLDPDQQVDEIYELNNTAVFTPKGRR